MDRVDDVERVGRGGVDVDGSGGRCGSVLDVDEVEAGGGLGGRAGGLGGFERDGVVATEEMEEVSMRL